MRRSTRERIKGWAALVALVLLLTLAALGVWSHVQLVRRGCECEMYGARGACVSWECPE